MGKRNKIQLLVDWVMVFNWKLKIIEENPNPNYKQSKKMVVENVLRKVGKSEKNALQGVKPIAYKILLIEPIKGGNDVKGYILNKKALLAQIKA